METFGNREILLFSRVGKGSSFERIDGVGMPPCTCSKEAWVGNVWREALDVGL